MFLIVGSTFAFLILAAEGRIGALYMGGGLGALTLLTAHSLWISQDSFRSIESGSIVWAYYCLFGFFFFYDRDLRRPVALTLVLLATGVSVYGVYQYIFGLDQMYNLVLTSGADEAVRVPILELFETQRIFSTFALPGTLWGFLILTLPLHALFWRRGHRLANTAIVANIALILGVALLTKSFGLVAGLFFLGIGWLFTSSGRALIKKSVLVALLMLPVAVGILATRVTTYNPVSLRLQNWMSAWEMFVSHPWGAGLNTYAVLYLQHQQLGANETQFAHNTPIQLLAEFGVLALAAGAVGLYWGASRLRRPFDFSTERRAILLALTVWGTHNLIDINVYFASLGTIGVVLLAVFARGSERAVVETAPISLVRIAVAVSVVVLIASASMYVSGELLHRSRVEIENQELETARETLAAAARINPFDSSIFHESGQVSLELYQRTLETYLLEDTVSHFRRAIDLSPRKVGPHTGLSLAMATMNQTEDALAELAIAQRLHPASRQTSAIRRLIEGRQVGPVEEEEVESPPDEDEGP